MFNHKIKENEFVKKTKELEKVQALRNLGIIWICLGAANPVYFILGFVFLLTSVVKSKRISVEEVSRNGGYS